MIPRCARRGALTALCLCLALSGPAHAAAPPDVGGPLADFWAKVKRDWSRRLEGLNRGSSQTAIWVALVWDGPDALEIRDLARDLQNREARRWVRSQITDHRWSAIRDKRHDEMLALRQNVILLGTPWDNPLVERALDQTPIAIRPGAIRIRAPVVDDRGRVTVDSRQREGHLLLITITPNPIHPRFYALVITGTSPDVLPMAVHVPYGESDYVIFRGRRLVEQGYFEWEKGRPVADRVGRALPFSEHFAWRTYVMGRFRIHYDPVATPADGAARIGRRLDAEIDRLAAFYGIDATRTEPIDCYLYASLDEKVNQTADASPAHVDRASGVIHALHAGDPDDLGSLLPSLVATVLLRRSGGWGPDGEREMPGFALALSLAASDHFDTIPLEEWAVRSRRDRGWMPMDILFVRRPDRLDGKDLRPIEAAAFVRDLMLRAGPAEVSRFYRTAKRSDFRRHWREIFGHSIPDAESDWVARRPAAATAVAQAAASPGDRPAAGEAAYPDAVPEEILAAFRRRDPATFDRLMTGIEPTAAVETLRARAAFRAGRFDEAIARARAALALPAGSAEERAWARLTAGRAHAASGRTLAATLELESDEIHAGPETVHVIAALWLESLGRPLNRRAAHRILMQQAESDLMNFDWDRAEERLKAVLAADPLNREAHATLGEVYMSKYQYWYDWLLLDRELFPAESMADPESYKYLADKGRRELKIAGQLPFGEEDTWLSTTGPVDPGRDQAAPHFFLGKVHFLRGDHDAARRELETALTLERGRGHLAAYCHLYLGRIAAARGDVPEARSQFESALAMKVSGEVTKLASEEMRKLPDRGR